LGTHFLLNQIHRKTGASISGEMGFPSGPAVATWAWEDPGPDCTIGFGISDASRYTFLIRAIGQ